METDKQRKRKGFFKTLVTILLGTRKEYTVEDIGVFSGKVCIWMIVSALSGKITPCGI